MINIVGEEIKFKPQIPELSKDLSPNQYSGDVLYISKHLDNSSELEYMLLHDSNNIVPLETDYNLFIESMINAAYSWKNNLERIEIFGPNTKPIIKFKESIDSFLIPIPINKNKETINSNFISYIHAGEGLILEFVDLDGKYTILPKNEFFVYYSLCAIISCADKDKLNFYTDKQTGEIIYIKPPGRFMDFILNSKKELFLSNTPELEYNENFEKKRLEVLVEHDLLWEKEEFGIRSNVILTRYKEKTEFHIISKDDFSHQNWETIIFEAIYSKNNKTRLCLRIMWI